MKTLTQHIEHLHTKPHHIRHRVAFGAAAGVTGLIGVIWLVSSVSTGSFALKKSSFADATNGPVVAAVSSAGVPQNLAGAAAAPALEDTEGPARIQIVNVTQKPTPKAEQTTIPF